jgi:hypothetical protein
VEEPSGELGTLPGDIRTAAGSRNGIDDDRDHYIVDC